MRSARPAGDFAIDIRSWVVAGLVAVRSGSPLLRFAAHVLLDVPLFYALACRAAT